MILRKVAVLLAVFSSLGAFAGGCQSGGVGDPCTPEDEYQSTFSGFSAKEVNVESRSFQCETRVCLVNHFRGRVSCPLGQDAAHAGSYAANDNIVKKSDAAGCRLPGSSGANADVVTVTVSSQCTSRKAQDTVYCSCRCDGPDSSATYCKCPTGFTCSPFPEFDRGAAAAKAAGGGSAQLRGSYCTRDAVKPWVDDGTCPVPVSDNPANDTAGCKPDTNNCGVKANP